MKIFKMGKIVKFITFNNVYAISLCPVGIYIDDDQFSSDTINHEMIHWEQQKEMLIIFYYLWYLFEWLFKKIRYKKDAYISISFEHEEYKHEDDPEYISIRKRFNWLKYVKRNAFNKFGT